MSERSNSCDYKPRFYPPGGYNTNLKLSIYLAFCFKKYFAIKWACLFLAAKARLVNFS